MKIRRGLASEAQTLTAIAKKAKASWRYTQSQLDAWRETLTIQPGHIGSSFTYVVEVESEVAGFYSLRNSEGTWILDHLWVLPKCMRRGLGRALLSHARSLAARDGAAYIAVDSEPYAEPFYLACGAQRVGAVAAPVEGEPLRERPQLVLPTHCVQ